MKAPLRAAGYGHDEPLDAEQLFWGEDLAMRTAPHRWTGTEWERIDERAAHK